jgi:cation/acetate symporter
MERGIVALVIRDPGRQHDPHRHLRPVRPHHPAEQNTTAADYYTGGRAFSGRQNGIAIAGDYLSAASFLGIAGAIALRLRRLPLLDRLPRRLARRAPARRRAAAQHRPFTMADVLAFRLRQRPVRMPRRSRPSRSRFFYLLAQMAGAGGLVALLLGITGRTGRASSSPSSAS